MIEPLITTITIQHAGVTFTSIVPEAADVEEMADALWQALVAIGYTPRTACTIGESMSDHTRYGSR